FLVEVETHSKCEFVRLRGKPSLRRMVTATSVDLHKPSRMSAGTMRYRISIAILFLQEFVQVPISLTEKYVNFINTYEIQHFRFVHRTNCRITTTLPKSRRVVLAP